MQITKLGIIGLGHMGGYHATATRTIAHAELVGIADPNPENWKKIKSPHVKKTKSFHEWIEEVDGIIIAAPTALHYEIAKECLERGKHILLEKPLTKNYEQAKELFAIAKEKDLTLHAGHVERFNGAVQELKKLIHKPYLIECHRMGPFTTRAINETVILDLMIHDLDIIVSLAQSPVKRFDVVANTVRSPLADIATVQVEFENGIIASVKSSRVSHTKQRSMAIHQESAFIKLDFTTQDIFIHRHTSEDFKVGHNQMKYRQEGMVERLFVYKDNPLKLEIEHFIRSIETGKKRIRPEQDLEALKLTLEIEKAIKGRTLYDSDYSRDGKPTETSL